MQCGTDGMCTPEGLCAFPDEACESGHRYGQSAGALSGMCVEPAAADATGEGGEVGDDSTATSTEVDGDDVGDTSDTADTADVDTSVDVDVDDTGPAPDACDALGEPDLECWAGADGWSGPFVAMGASSEPSAPCPGGSRLVASFGNGRLAAGFSCDCLCSNVDACGSVTVYDNQGACNPGAVLGTASEGECTGFLGSLDSLYFDFPEPLDDCGTPADAFSFEEPQWLGQTHVCSWGSSTTCADGTGLCLPATRPEGGQRCLIREGEHDCPGDPYTNGATVYAGYVDSRSCSACGCASSSGMPTFCRALLYGSDDCSGDANEVDALQGSTCESFPGNDGGTVEVVTIDDCAVQGGTPSGTVTPTGPVTICCAP